MLHMEAHGIRSHRSEIDRAGTALLHGVAVSFGTGQPPAVGCPAFDIPRLGHLAAAPRLVVVPIDGGTLYAFRLREGVAHPLRRALFGPPVEVGDGAVVPVGRHKTVVDTAQGR